MLLMTEAGIRRGMCQSIYRYAKANNKYMKNYNKHIILSYLVYLDTNSLYRWSMPQKLHVNGLKWVKHVSECNSIQFNESFIRNYYENSDIGYFLEVDIDYLEKLLNVHENLRLLPER